MSISGSTNQMADNDFRSLMLYNDQYLGHSLISPSLWFWDKLNQPLDVNSRLTSIVCRSFVLIAFVFSLVLYVPGVLLKSIDYIITPLPDSQSVKNPEKILQVQVKALGSSKDKTSSHKQRPSHQSSSNASKSQPSLSRLNIANPPILNLVTLAQRDPLLCKEAQKLNALQAFADEPTQANYYSLTTSLRYLVAGRYTYPVTWGWCISTRFQLMETLENDFRSRVDSKRLAKAAQEAVELQEKILFAKTLLSMLKRGGNIEELANVNPRIFHEINECLQKASINQGLGFGGDMLRKAPNDSIVKKTVERLIRLWDSAHYDISFADFK